ncbi:hypothetical protein BGZ70_001586 [Mortierella alpina]|uniref:Uncharacterized protein n=1 Tax=Mortierella alpina TaxID=64518 RepID=A0A9P6M527_MORAP|nr:hypothetical protein BGZ70_001586 [Mortierella alpina]
MQLYRDPDNHDAAFLGYDVCDLLQSGPCCMGQWNCNRWRFEFPGEGHEHFEMPVLPYDHAERTHRYYVFVVLPATGEGLDPSSKRVRMPEPWPRLEDESVSYTKDRTFLEQYGRQMLDTVYFGLTCQKLSDQEVEAIEETVRTTTLNLFGGVRVMGRDECLALAREMLRLSGYPVREAEQSSLDVEESGGWVQSFKKPEKAATRPSMMSRDGDSDHGSPAPRIRVGYTRGSEGFDNPRANGHPQPRLSFHEPQLHHQQQQQHHQLHQLQQQQQQQQLPSSNVSIIGRDHVLVEIDHQLNSVAELLAEIVLLPQDSPVDPALFLAVGCLELYDQDQRHCVQSLREERKRLMERRQAIEIELMRQDTAEIELRAEEKRIHSLELATETMAIPPESLVPLSKSRTKLLDDLGNILSKIRTLLETVHIQYEVDQEQLLLRQQQPQRKKESGQLEDKPQAGVEEEEEEVLGGGGGGGGEGGGKMEIQDLEGQDGVTLVNMTMFQRHGLMDLYDRDPVKCTSLLRVEHARLAERRDELELEYERQRTALLRAMPRG